VLAGANGGVASGGFRAFASGGIANKPTLGMIGEGRYNEAVVPLPDGKSIPISGGAGNVTVNVAVDAAGQSAATETTGSGARELGYRISQAVQSELVEQQRPGGLLSSY
jgi:phage-related minor tail protein